MFGGAGAVYRFGSSPSTTTIAPAKPRDKSEILKDLNKKLGINTSESFPTTFSEKVSNLT